VKILLAPDSFKGTMSSTRVIEILATSAKKVFPSCEIVKVAMADGGEGTVEALVSAANGEYRYSTVKDPLGNEIVAGYGVLDENTAIIEMAAASGLVLVPDEKRNPLHTSSYGTGQLIRHVLEENFKTIIIAIGGSATNDGGIGAMEALGVRFLDKKGDLVQTTGEHLIDIADIDASGMYSGTGDAKFTVMCDVGNPLLGENGATFVYGAQKGGTGEQLRTLEKGMTGYARILKKKFHIDIAAVSGAGAAGGLSAALMVFLGAELKSGIKTVLEIIRFDELLKNADLVVTGEGRLDGQSSSGKVISGIGQACKEKGIPVVAIAGEIGNGAEKIYEQGIMSVMTTVNKAMDLKDAMERSEELLMNAADRMFRFIQIGGNLC
jgi:glycerate kinase